MSCSNTFFIHTFSENAALLHKPPHRGHHRTNLMKKLDTHNIAVLVRIAMKTGLVK
jgi:FixJ family two-component response regulator